MTSNDFTHPEDAAALNALQSIPSLGGIVKAFMDMGIEQMQRGLNLASKVKLSPQQLPRLYDLLPPICKQLGIDEPDFFLEMSPFPNAYAMGDTQTAITITSAIVDLMTEDELRAVIAHECGHILCHHMLYHTLAAMILQASGAFKALTSIAAPLKYALLYWERKSELSCDRVAAYITSPQIAATMLARLAGGSKSLTVNLNLAELAGQADLYDAMCKKGLWNKTLQTWAVMNLNHPFTNVRIREMLLWIDSDDYKRLKQQDLGSCPRCGGITANGWLYCQHCGNKL